MVSGLRDLLGRFSIQARLIFLAVALLLAMAGSSLYLLRTLDRASATNEEAHRVSDLIDVVSEVRAAFNDLRYWQTDLAVSLLTLAETNAGDARQRLDKAIEKLSASLPGEALALRRSSEQFDAAARQAVDAYTDDQRVIGNTLFAKARQNGLDVDRILTGLEDDLRIKAQDARASVLEQFSDGARVSLIVTAVSVLLGGLLTFVILASILQPLNLLVRAIHRITAGETDAELPPPSRDELGKMSEAVVLLRDSIQERAELSRETERQRRTLFDAIESIDQGFALYGPDDRLQIVNSHYRELQPKLADILKPGVPFIEVLRAAVRSGIETDRTEDDWIADRLKTRGSAGGRLERFGSGRWVHINERRTHDGGVVAVYTDVTDLRQRQTELEEAKEEADRATQVKSEFLANMSHELRTPLNAIIGYSQILQEDALDAGQTEAIADLKKIESAGNHLLHLINDILDLSKIEAGRMDVFLETFDVGALVHDVRSLVEPLAAGNSNTLVVDCPADIGSISSDLIKVKQALLNLLSNATKFTENGTVTLKVERNAADIRFSVIDTGIGMTDAQMAKLFQAFSQADNSTTRRFGGTGLGLAISRSFARTLGGDLTVASRPGEGSHFTLTLPLGEAVPDEASEPSSSAAGAAEPPRPATVLVVDDEPSASHIIGSHLSREGYTLLYASSGAEAVEMARLHKPDAITLDIMMPHVDGWSVLVELKKDPELAMIPVVIISISTERSLGFTLGAAAMLTKPLDRAELTQVLKRQFATAVGVDPALSPVLIIEDDADTRKLMERVVEKLEYRSASVSNGREGIDWLNANPPPSAILLDLQMPEMNGFEFLLELRQKEAWANVPVIVVTAKELSAQERQMLSDNTQSVIAKGQAAHIELSQAIRNVTSKASRPASITAV